MLPLARHHDHVHLNRRKKEASNSGSQAKPEECTVWAKVALLGLLARVRESKEDHDDVCSSDKRAFASKVHSRAAATALMADQWSQQKYPG